MTNTNTMTSAEIAAFAKRGAKYFAVEAYGENKGEIISWHKTYDAAARASKSCWRTILPIGMVEPIDEFVAFVESVKWRQKPSTQIQE